MVRGIMSVLDAIDARIDRQVRGGARAPR